MTSSPQDQPRFRLLLADDQADSRDRIRSVVSSEHDVVGEVSDGSAVAGAVRDLHPDMLLLDISMPELSGFGVMRRLAKEGLDVKVVLVTDHTERRYVEEAQKAGASAYVLKSQMARELLPALRQVACGGEFACSGL